MFIGGQINFSGYSNTDLDTLFKDNSNSVGFTIAPDFEYFITPKIGMQTSFGNINYTYLSSKNTNSDMHYKSSNDGLS